MLVAFLVGLISTIHCIGMCGGLVGAMTMSLRPEIRENRAQLLLYSFAFNSGRILSYAVAGFLLGWFGQSLSEILMPNHGVGLLRLLAAIMIIVLGFYIAGWFPGFSRIEKLGMPLWKYLQPIGQRLLPVTKLWQAFVFGAIWGWLPCGLVYYMLIMSPAAAANGALNSALFMFVFGLGTLVPLISAGFLTGRLSILQESPRIRQISGLLLILMGIIGLVLSFLPGVRHQLHFHVF